MNTDTRTEQASIFPIPSIPIRERERAIPFSEICLLLVVAIKGLWDGLWWVPLAKWIYPFLLFFAGFICYAGYSYNRLALKRSGRAIVGGPSAATKIAAALSVSYVAYIAGVYFIGGQQPGTLEQAFKTVYPFLFYWSLRFLPLKNLRYAAIAYALLVIIGNAALVPFESGWIDWGGTRTFKGWYFFKTDLAYSVVTAALVLIATQNRKLGALLLCVFGATIVEVYLANARMNYLLLGIVFCFLLWRSGIRNARTWLLGFGAIVVVVVLVLAYRPEKMLMFDTSNAESFTQGRSKTWDILVDEGLANATGAELAVGGGLGHDTDLVVAHADFNERRDAHNEFLHVIITQGIFGMLLYFGAWISLVWSVEKENAIPELRGIAILALTLLWIQGLTDLVSLKATKTWPTSFVLLIVVAESQRRATGRNLRLNTEMANATMGRATGLIARRR